MKRRRRYGEIYSGIPYPDDFKNKMLALFPDSPKLKEALDGGWDSIGGWFNELCSSPSFSAEAILAFLGQEEEGIAIMRGRCEAMLQRRKELKALSDEWQRIVYLDDQGCRPWKEEE